MFDHIPRTLKNRQQNPDCEAVGPLQREWVRVRVRFRSGLRVWYAFVMISFAFDFPDKTDICFTKRVLRPASHPTTNTLSTLNLSSTDK